MKNALLILLLLAIVGGTTAFIVFRNDDGTASQNREAGFGLETAEVTEATSTGVIVTGESVEGAEVAAASSEAPVRVDTGDETDIRIDAEQGAEAPFDEAAEAFPTWKTLSGMSFEAKLIWVSATGKSVRFERPDGSTFVYSSEYLEDEHQGAIRSLMIAKNGSGGQAF